MPALINKVTHTDIELQKCDELLLKLKTMFEDYHKRNEPATNRTSFPDKETPPKPPPTREQSLALSKDTIERHEMKKRQALLFDMTAKRREEKKIRDDKD